MRKDSKILLAAEKLKKLDLYVYFSHKCVSFLIKDDKLLEKYNKICEKVSNAIKKEFGNNPVYNKKILEN